MDRLPRWADVVLVPLISLLLAGAISAIVIWAIGESPWQALKTMVDGAVGSAYGWGYTLYYATSFIFTGLAAEHDAILYPSFLAGMTEGRSLPDALKLMQADGIQIQNASPALIDQIRRKTAGIESAWVEAVKAKGIDGEAVMRDLRAEIKKVQAGN